MFYKKAKQEAEFDLQAMEDKVKRQKKIVQGKMKNLEDTYDRARYILKQVDEFQGHISGAPQKYTNQTLNLEDAVENGKITDKFADENNCKNMYSAKSVLTERAINVVMNITPAGKVIQKTVESKKNKEACDQAYHQIEKLQEYYEDLKEEEVKLESRNKKLKILMKKTFQYLVKLQNCNITDYKQFDSSQESDFKTMILNSLSIKELFKEQ